MSSRVLVIGLDGASWDLLEPRMGNGSMPNLARIVDNGVSGPLASVVPPITPPAWTSFVTGVTPQRHGIFGFLAPKGSLSRKVPVNSRHINKVTFYEVLDWTGKKCIFINLPIALPPKADCIFVAHFSDSAETAVHPPSLIEELAPLRRYRSVPKFEYLVRNELQLYVSDIRQLEAERFECGKALFRKPWDLFFVLFNGTDWVQHAISKKSQAGLSLDEKSEVDGYFQDLDSYIGWLLNERPPQSVVMIVSDHGFKRYERVFWINGWLAKEGYLRIKPSMDRSANLFPREFKTAVERESVFVRPPSWIYYKWLRPVLPLLRSLFAFVSSRTRIRLDSAFEPEIASTIAYSPIFECVYLNKRRFFVDGILGDRAADEYREEIARKLAQIRDPQNGAPVLSCVQILEQNVSAEPSDPFRPDILIHSETHMIDPTIGSANPLVETESRLDAHSLEGIFVAFGSKIAKGKRVHSARLVDLAPTILWLLDTSVPDDMEGRVIPEILQDETTKPIRRMKTIQERERIRSKMPKLLRPLTQKP